MNLGKIKLKVYSKINLSLNIVGGAGKMHALDTVMASAGIADVITVCERLDDRINVEYSGGVNFGANDSALRAANELREQFGDFGADIFIEKNIPVGAGLGGSSADAAGVIRALDVLFDFSCRGLKKAETALKIGSDVPYMLYGGFSRVRGNGEKTEKINCSAKIPFVLAKGEGGVSTAAAYAEFDKFYPDKILLCSDNDALVKALEKGDTAACFREAGNALSEPSRKLNPCITETLLALESVGALKSIMTGSGSGCVGFFGDLASAEIAAQKLKARGLYAVASETKESGICFL